MKGVIYARFSCDHQREESIEGQVRECRDYAEKNGIAIIGVYADRALTGKTDKRPQFQKMIKDSEKRMFEVVIVWKLDRFSRNRYDSATYKTRLKKNGVRVVSAKEQISDTPEGIILESMLEGMAEYYSADLAVKITRGMKENALKCRYNGGGMPFGYMVGPDQKLVINPQTAPIVVEIFQRYANGENIRDIIKSLNKRGIKTTRGSEFRQSSLDTMLTNTKYLGVYRSMGEVIEGGVPQIIDQELFDKVYGEGAVSDEAAFRAKVAEGLKNDLQQESAYRFGIDAKNALMKKNEGAQFPEAFLKRWLKATNEKMTDETIEKEFPQMLDELKWQLIKDKIAKANNMKVENAEVEAYAKHIAQMQFAQYGLVGMEDALLERYAKDMLKKEDQVRGIVERVLENKVFDFVKSAVKLDNKTVTMEQMQELYK